MNNIILETPRCYIREINEADIAAEFKLYDSPHMTDYIPPLSDPETEVSLCREYAERVYGVYGYGMWGVFDRVTDRLIGEAGLEPRFDTAPEPCVDAGPKPRVDAERLIEEAGPEPRVDAGRMKYPYDWMFGEHCAELGFCIAEDLWGQGYCKEVCRAILDNCSERFEITDVFARTVPENIASVRVLTSLGFRECGSCADGDVYRLILDD